MWPLAGLLLLPWGHCHIISPGPSRAISMPISNPCPVLPLPVPQYWKGLRSWGPACSSGGPLHSGWGVWGSLSSPWQFCLYSVSEACSSSGQRCLAQPRTALRPGSRILPGSCGVCMCSLRQLRPCCSCWPA